ncbi:unnamed protein product [Parascedosporium putredinis]|uniref:Histone chaperone RTT106/FACT complex subunit SPT16-like middle domain-containing protein n=1 Tax=Parascedosporium putredinis TaxID=1442378 RepID=A0A9P1ME67_9PEZI|nr:unnamed protein product [Parascedosporium putredinis]CAI8004043.1 unnamed protein product [Parascedosporium putredinis]
MPAALDSQKLGLVFQARPDIIEGIKAAADSPARVTLFNNIASFVYDQLQTNGEPSAKRRRVDEGASTGAATNGANGVDASKEPVLLEVKEISVSMPQRKKFDLCFTANHIYARAANAPGPVQGIVYRWQDIALAEYVFYLPVPEKAQVQHNYILFPKGTALASLKGGPPAIDPLVFTVPATAPKQGTIGGTDAPKASSFSDSYQTLFSWAFKNHLRKAGNAINIVAADPNKFHSEIPQPHRPKEKAVHVKGFRGSKDGYLFFLENGILWGYKKPLLFIPLDRISAVSYTSVLQRTFNMVIEVFASEGEGTEEVEFGMIDQADYGGIDESYIKKNRLQDRSMAEQRKAKLELAENIRAAKKAGGAEGDEVPTNGAEADVTGGMSELEKAQLEAEQALQDDEDEDEEDYDPGSDGESEGSGSNEEEEEDGEEEEEEVEEEDAEVKMEIVKEEKPVAKAPPAKAPPAKAPPAPKPKAKLPARNVTQVLMSGTDDFDHSRDNDDDLDMEERFDVVG